MRNIVVIDCGASNCLVQIISNDDNQEFNLSGFSPVRDSIESFPKIEVNQEISDVYFYGTAMKGEYVEQAKASLSKQFPNSNIFIATDLEAAAIATANNRQGYIHIMGTGSSVCYWDGTKIHFPKTNLGYLWEDFASGYDIGKTIIDYWNTGKLNEREEAFLTEKEGSITSFIQRVYASDEAKSILAKTSLYLDELEEETRNLIINECLDKYFSKNIDIFADSKEHHFVGSMAYLFREEIEMKMKSRNLQLGHIQKDTSLGLLKYYKSQIANQHE